MKKISTWALALIATLIMGLSLTSCTRDQLQSDQLTGRWKGDFGMSVYDNYGHNIRASYTIIEFFQAGIGSTRGTGKQYDYYAYGAPFRWEYFVFDWNIRNGVVYLTYRTNPELNTCIYEYRMNGREFTGYIGNTYTTFYMEKLYDWNWNGYRGDYDYAYYANTRGTAPSDSLPEVRHCNINNMQ